MPKSEQKEGEGKQGIGVIDQAIVDKFLAEDAEGYTDTWRKSRAGDVRENLILMQLFEGKTSYKLELDKSKSGDERDAHYKRTGKFLSNYIAPTREQYQEAVEAADAYLREVKEREDKSAADLVEHLVLIPEDTVDYTYNKHYGVYLQFKPDGTTEVEDEDQYYKVEPGQVFNGVSHFVERVRKSQEKVAKLLPHIPWGNLGGTKGIKPLIDAFDTVEAYSGYLPNKERDEKYQRDNEKFHGSE